MVGRITEYSSGDVRVHGRCRTRADQWRLGRCITVYIDCFELAVVNIENVLGPGGMQMRVPASRRTQYTNNL